MADHSLDFRLFRYAIVSADHGSFRRAAAALNIQQSTVSRGVRSLEHRLGAPLFERSHAGIRPTPAGERFLQEAALGFEHLQRAMQRISAVQRGEHGELTVAVSVPFLLLGDALERFRDKHRAVSVELVEGNCDEGVVLIKQRKADIAFVTKAPSDDAFGSVYLREEQLVAVLPIDHPFASAREVMVEELRSEKFILGAGGLGPEVADYLRRQMARSGGGPNLQPHRIGQCDLINMVARGFGITVVVGGLPNTTPEGVVLVPLAGRNCLSIYALWMASNANPALKGLLGILRRRASAPPRDSHSGASD